jgi:COP9 signalosome complex subunit 1
MESIRSRALLSYFAPFATVSLDKMSSAFGIESNHLVPQVVQLIQRGTMEARIDGQAGVLVAKKKDVRIEAFKNALKEGKEIERKTKGMAFRSVHSLYHS